MRQGGSDFFLSLDRGNCILWTHPIKTADTYENAFKYKLPDLQDSFVSFVFCEASKSIYISTERGFLHILQIQIGSMLSEFRFDFVIKIIGVMQCFQNQKIVSMQLLKLQSEKLLLLATETHIAFVSQLQKMPEPLMNKKRI